jgi:putative ABC transport system permease protein
MFRNYFITAIRNLKRRRGYFVLNMAGLAIGLAVSLIVFTIVRYERSFEKHQADYEQIYNVATQEMVEGELTRTSGIPYPALQALRNEIPQVTFGSLNSYGAQLNVLDAAGNTVAGRKFIENTGVFFADPEFFDVMEYRWLMGSPQVLSDPESIVLCRSIAEKYFGSWQQAPGRLIRFDGRFTCKVAGIIEDSPQNTDFPLYAVASFEQLKKVPFFGYTDDWGSITTNYQIYAKRPAAFSEAQFAAALKTYSAAHYKESAGTKSNYLRPLRSIHFDDLAAFGSHQVSEEILNTYMLVGLLIVLMACINFVNLSTAQAVLRSKEVGVRKVLGSNRRQLQLLLFGETLVIVFAATLLAAGLAAVLMPFVHHVVPGAEFLEVFSIENLLFLLLAMFAVTVVAGFYPALVISGFNPGRALKNKLNTKTIGGVSLRRGLVAMQFVISQMLIIGTLVVVGQMDYVQHADMGVKKDGILILSNNGDSTVLAGLPVLKERLKQLPGVTAVTAASDVPSSLGTWTSNFAYDHRNDEAYPIALKFTDPDYFKTFGLHFVAGGPYAASDTMREMVINEATVKKLGLKSADEAIGKDLRIGAQPWKRICGVVNDFHTTSLHNSINPLVMSCRSKHYFTLSVSMHTANLEKSRKAIEAAWDRQYPDYVCSSAFFETNIEQFYRSEKRLTLLYEIFAAIAILISCLGLYGLISFMTVQKTKEVGIRKVLGAGVMHVVYLFSKEFTILIGVAFVIAAPAAWLLMDNWLQDFAFRISIGAGVFVLALVTSLLLAWLTVGWKAYRAARANPVNSLRAE